MGKLWPTVVVLLGVAVYLLIFNENSFEKEVIRGKRVLITGSSSGIGEQLAYEYAKLGARLLITARRRDLLVKVADECRRLGATEVTYVAADMSDAADRKMVVREAEVTLGGLDQLILNHALVNNGLWMSTPDNFAHLQKVIDVNFLSFVDVVSLSMEMLTSSSGSIGIVSSVNGRVAGAKFGHYAASKFALNGFFSSFRMEQTYRKTGISLTMCFLGLIDTEAARVVLKDSKNFHPKDVGVSPALTAAAILKSVTNRDFELYYPRISSVILITLNNLFPQTIENLIVSNIDY